MKKIIFAVLFFLYSMAAYSQSNDLGPITINANSMIYYDGEHKSSFSGNVVAQSDKYKLNTDKVDAYLNKSNEMIKIICMGNVVFTTVNIRSQSDRAEVDREKKTITLLGKAKVWQNENYFEGDRMTIYYETNDISVDGGSAGRAKAIFSLDNTTKKQ